MFLGNTSIDKFVHLTESRKCELKIICQYIHLIELDETSITLPLHDMHEFIKKHESKNDEIEITLLSHKAKKNHGKELRTLKWKGSLYTFAVVLLVFSLNYLNISRFNIYQRYNWKTPPPIDNTTRSMSQRIKNKCNPGASEVSDCCCPKTCTDEILDQYVGPFTCRERINFLIGNQKKSERSACTATAIQSEICEKCNPR